MNLQFNPSSFELVVLDAERKAFGIVGPMANDTRVEQRIVKANRSGRRLSATGPVNNSLTREQAILGISEQTGFDYVEDVMEGSAASLA